MKLRAGFVSNSSSTSFCLIGTKDRQVVGMIADKQGLDMYYQEYQDPDSHEWVTKEPRDCLIRGKFSHDEWIYVGNEEPYAVGLDAETVLAGRDLFTARYYVWTMIREKFNVGISLEDVELLYGRAGE